MTESEFNQRADAILAAVEDSIEASGADIDCETTGGVLQLAFSDRSAIVINRQTPLREIWLAAKWGGFHFAWQDGAWRNTRDGSELFATLGRCVSAQAGEEVVITP